MRNGWIVFWTLVGMSLAGFGLYLFNNVSTYSAHRDIDLQKDQAAKSATAAQMADQLTLVLSNMERHGITQGSSAVVFKKPTRDTGQARAILLAQRDLAREVAATDHTTVDAATQLHEMKATLEKLDIEAWGYARIHGYHLWIWWISTIMFWGGLFLGIYELIVLADHDRFGHLDYGVWWCWLCWFGVGKRQEQEIRRVA